MQQQKTFIEKTNLSASPRPHATTYHHVDVKIHPLNRDAQDTTMILSLLISGNKHFHESDHSNNDKEATTIAKPLGLELNQGNEVIVSSTCVPGNSLEWIDVRKKKEKGTLSKIHDHSWVLLRGK